MIGIESARTSGGEPIRAVIPVSCKPRTSAAADLKERTLNGFMFIVTDRTFQALQTVNRKTSASALFIIIDMLSKTK